MKKALFLTAAAISATLAFADYRTVFYSNGLPVSQTKVQNIQNIMTDGVNISQKNIDGDVKNFTMNDVDSVLFVRDTVTVNYMAETVVVDNPLQGLGLDVNVAGADVKVSTNDAFDLKDVVFVLTGKSSDGSFVMNQNKRVSVVFNNLSLASKKSAAVAFIGDKGVSLELQGKNSLADNTTRVGADSLNAALYVYDKLALSGLGHLEVYGNYKNGVFVKDNFNMNEASLYVKSVDVAVRVKDNFILNDGAVDMNAGSKGIDANDSIIVNGGSLYDSVMVDQTKGLAATAYIQTGGSVSIRVHGESCRGIKIDSIDVENNVPGVVAITGGNLSIDIYKGVASYGDDPAKPSAIKCAGPVNITGGVVDIYGANNTKAIRGISADGDIRVNGTADVTVNIQSNKGKAWCFKADGDIYINESCVKASFNTSNGNYPDDAGLYNPEYITIQ